MADLNWLRIKHPRGPREAFEDMCTLVFCTRLGLAHGVNRRINQKGIESDPVAIGGRVYAYQAKFYDAATQLSGKKDDLIGAVRAARQEGVTDLMFFVDKNLPDKVLNGDGTARVEPSWLAEINEAADGEGDEPKVTLDWWTLSRIESTLDMDAYRYIRDIYLGGDGGQAGYTDFYEWVCDRYYGDKGSDLYGNVPLSECYIEPTIKTLGRGVQSVQEFIESWVDDGTIAVIGGEPGHGKTSLCFKAVCDFFRSGWLTGKVSNAFLFSLNPTGTDAFDYDSFRFNSLLSWGGTVDRIEPEQRIKAKDCRNALVFLDGFDELLESYAVDLEDFIIEHVIKFQKRTGSHVIITTRNMAISSDKTVYDLGQIRIPIARLRAITKYEQLGWIRQYINRLRRSIAESPESIPAERINVTKKELEELQDYCRSFRQLNVDAGLEEILGIPIIFRMVVAARYLPKDGESISQIYDELFDATWKRYELLDIGETSAERGRMDAAKRRLSLHALRVFTADADTSVINGILESPWVFSFYTTRMDDEESGLRSRVGFLHRSIYQFFLAREIVSWFVRYGDGASSQHGRDSLSSNLPYLARRRVDETTLGYIRDMHSEINDGEPLDRAFVRAYEILKETDGILPLPTDEQDATQIKTVTPLVRANNVLWNVVSICSVCGHPVTTDRINVSALRMYDLTGCHLQNAKLKGASIEMARLSGADLVGADLTGANLSGADLAGARLAGANLTGANLAQAGLAAAHLTRASLTRAHLAESDLTRADLAGADLTGSNFTRARLSHAKLAGAHLAVARLTESDLTQANLAGADLTWADLARAILMRTRLADAVLARTDLAGANLEGADLEGANLKRAILRKVSLINANLTGVDFMEADLWGANLEGAHIVKREDLEKAMLDGAKLDKAIFEERG